MAAYRAPGAPQGNYVFEAMLDEIAEKLNIDTGTSWWVIKAQIHAGGRGKGGGVKLAKSIEEVRSISEQILGMYLITPQTSSSGKLVNQVLIAEDVYYPGESETDEFYMSVLLNRSTGRNMIMYSAEGGMDIEKVAAENPEKIITTKIDLKKSGPSSKEINDIISIFKLDDLQTSQASNLIKSLYKIVEEKDLVSVDNPVYSVRAAPT